MPKEYRHPLLPHRPPVILPDDDNEIISDEELQEILDILEGDLDELERKIN